MDGAPFATLTQTLKPVGSRRGAVAAVLRILLGGGPVAQAHAGKKHRHQKRCRKLPVGALCGTPDDCCSGVCGWDYLATTPEAIFTCRAQTCTPGGPCTTDAQCCV